MVKKWSPIWLIQKHMVGDTIASGTSTQTHGLMHHVFGTSWPDALWSRAFGVAFTLGRLARRVRATPRPTKYMSFGIPGPSKPTAPKFDDFSLCQQFGLSGDASLGRQRVSRMGVGGGCRGEAMHLKWGRAPGDFWKMLDNKGSGAAASHFYLYDHLPGVKAVAGKGPRVFDVDWHYCNIT